MKYPMINSKPRREVRIPQLSGGLNLRDSLTGIRDNQMTDCLNMWYKNGLLKTRPRLQTAVDTTKLNSNGVFQVFNEIIYNDRVLIGISGANDNGKTQIQFYWQGKNDAQPIEQGILIDEENEYENGKNLGYFVIEKDGILFCYTEKYKIFRCEFKAGGKEWKLIENDEIYIPTVLAHAKATNNGLSYTGTMLEGYNLLTNSYKMIYSSINLEDIEEGVTWMRYPYISKLPDNVDTTILVKFTTIDGKVHNHSAVWTGGKELRCFEKIEGESTDGLYLYVTGRHVHFTVEKNSSKIATVKKEDFVEDNLEIKVIYSKPASDENLNKVFKMTKSIWFGGTSNGINSGSRVLLCGNTDAKEKSLVIWSALNNPLYFNENNYAYVGNKAEAVTAFGKQGENLVIFKPNEIYYSYYVLNSSINADDLINQTVVDYEANSAYFPIIQLNNGIGCDCPDTVQLCRNRLVWLNSDGKVYTLVSANQYSEMTVYCVSEMVSKKICRYSKSSLKNATSHDFDGHYVLMIGNEFFVMDYNSYGYTHIYGYSKNEDANLLIPWYFWHLNVSEPVSNFFGFKDFIFSFCKDADNNFSVCVLCNERIDGFKEEKIISSVTSKLFDFSVDNYLKNVSKISLGIGNNGGAPISVNMITDIGYECEEITTDSNQTDERDINFIVVKNLHPTIYSVKIFGIKLECNGDLMVNSLTLQYRILGGVK